MASSIICPIVISYILGSIPFSYLLGRIIKGIDIRKMGSCNVGATNLMRCAGRPLGVSALVLDISKGVIAVTVIAALFYKPDTIYNPHIFKVFLGFSAVAGHVWTVFLKFKGGKGVATAIGVLIGLSPLAAISGFLVWCLFAVVFRYVSLSSIAMAISLPLFMIILAQPKEYLILSLLLCLVIVYRHYLNIYRIVKGTEYKIGQKVSKD
jgi:acyl phosphate:glycerol-3-phosphate acyltransferase